MKKLKKEMILAFFTLIIFISTVSAEIFLGQTVPIYNFGDYFNLNMSIFSNSDSSDFFIATLVCSNGEIELYKTPLTVLANSNREIIISTVLGNFLVREEGECFVKAIFNNEEAKSQRFYITKGVEVSLNIVGVAFSPGEKVIINGEAKKVNGNPLNGFVEININGMNFSHFGRIDQGKFNLDFNIPQNARSGNYEIKARVYERDSSGEVINEGNASNVIKIRQVTKEIDIALNVPTISPEYEITYTALVYDQARESADVDIALIFYRPDNSIFKKELIKSGETRKLKILSDFPPGHWKIEAKLNNLQQKREFYVEEYKKLAFKLVNNTLIVTNAGNVPYTNIVEISIGGISDLKEIKNLPVGDSKSFKLAAPNGEYEIKASEGGALNGLGTTFLTGRAISVGEVDSFLSRNLSIIIILILIFFIATIVLLIIRRIKRKRLGLSNMLSSIQPSQKFVKKEIPRAETSVIDKGQKQESAIISLKIKNLGSLADTEAPKSIESALWRAKGTGAKIYSDGNFRIIVLAPILTKERDNSIKAISLALNIERILKAYNRRYSVKIDFGIGVNLGNLIVEYTEGRFRFTSLENTLAIAKRVSEESNAEVTISEQLRLKIVGKAKIRKLPQKNLYVVEKVVDRSEHQDYIKKLSLK